MTCIYQVSSDGLNEIAHSDLFSRKRHYANLADAQQYMWQLMREIGQAHNKAMLMDKGYTVDMQWAGLSSLTHASGPDRLTQNVLRLSEYEEKWEEWECGYRVQIVSITVREDFAE